MSEEKTEDRFEGIVGYFGSADALQHAAHHAREAFFTDVEIYMPVDDKVTVEAALPGESPVRWLALLGGLGGLTLGLGMTVWMSLDYPLVTGGKPVVSLPPFLVIAFELMLLLAALGAIAGFLLLGRLPHLTPSTVYSSDLAVDTFALFIRCPPHGAPLRAERVLREAGAEEIRTVFQEKRGLLGEPVRG